MSKTTKKSKVKVVRKIGRPTNLPPFWAELARLAGGVDKLGVEIGKSVRQLRRIAHRQSPLTGSTKIATRAAAEKHRVLPQFEEWERGGEADRS